MLPFVVQPRRKPIIERIGNDESGVIEIERRGFLSTGEKAFVQQVQQNNDATTSIINLSRKVASKHKLGMDKAYNLILQVISGSEAKNEEEASLMIEIEEGFADSLTDIVTGLAAAQTREELVYAACMIKYRVDQDMDINEIAVLHPDLIIGLAELYRKEEKRSTEGFDGYDSGETISVEEAEKKPKKATSSRSRSTTGD